MLKRPKEFDFLSVFLVLVAASFPLQIMLAYDYGPMEWHLALERLAPLNWLVILTAITHAALVYHASPWVPLSAGIFLGAVVWNNWLVAQVGINHSLLSVVMATLGAIAAHAVLFREKARAVLLNPKLRWWLTPRRKKAQLHTIVRPVLGGEMKLTTFDVSESGAFISLEDGFNWISSFQVPVRNLEVGARCSVRLSLDQIRVIQCQAEVVRHAVRNGRYPDGFAVRFICLDNEQRRALSEYVESGVIRSGTPELANAA